MGLLLGRLKELFSSREMEIVLVGLENAGKSTLTSQLSFDKPSDKGPTIGLDVRTFKKENVQMKVWDLGGQGELKSTISLRVVKIRTRLRRNCIRGRRVRQSAREPSEI